MCRRRRSKAERGTALVVRAFLIRQLRMRCLPYAAASLYDRCAGCSRRAGRASELVAALRRTITSEKAVLLLCTPMGGSGLAMRPVDAGDSCVGVSRPERAGGYIDVFWVVHDGALTFVLAHLLQACRRRHGCGHCCSGTVVVAILLLL